MPVCRSGAPPPTSAPPPSPPPQVGGDDSELCIAAASVLAKVTRDGIMEAADPQHPLYDFAAHKGYPTRRHLEALAEAGPCRLHRRTFAPVAAAAARRAAPAEGDAKKEGPGGASPPRP